MKYLKLNSFIYSFSEDYLEKDIRTILKTMNEETKGFYADEFLKKHGLHRENNNITPKLEFEFKSQGKRWIKINK